MGQLVISRLFWRIRIRKPPSWPVLIANRYYTPERPSLAAISVDLSNLNVFWSYLPSPLQTVIGPDPVIITKLPAFPIGVVEQGLAVIVAESSSVRLH